MRKLRLDPEALLVETFAPRGERTSARGTVHAQSFITEVGAPGACSEAASQYCASTDVHLPSCGNSCVNECFPTGPDCG